MNHIKKVAFALLMLCTSFTYAQVELTNQVVDFQKDKPIETASVYIKNTTIGTITNVDGKFVLKVPKENITDTLVVSSIGYSTVKIPIDKFDASFIIYLRNYGL